MPLLEIIKPSHLCFPFVWMRPERWCSRGACEEACDGLGVVRGGINGFCRGREGMIVLSISCRSKHGASHREES
jgi:hypothetical protein